VVVDIGAPGCAIGAAQARVAQVCYKRQARRRSRCGRQRAPRGRGRPVLRKRELLVEHLTDTDLSRIEELLRVYDDANIGFVDAANVAIAHGSRDD